MAFDSWGGSWAASWGLSWTRSQTTTTSDNFLPEDYKRYRKKLQKAANAADEYNRSKYIKEAVKAAEIVEELSVASPIIEKIADAVEHDRKVPEFEFSEVQAELNKVIKYLDDMIEMKASLQEAEDELILMMAL